LVSIERYSVYEEKKGQENLPGEKLFEGPIATLY